MKLLPFNDRVTQFVKDNTKEGDVFSSSSISKQMGGRDATTQRVASRLGSCPYAEYIPDRVILTGPNAGKIVGRGKWRRIEPKEVKENVT